MLATGSAKGERVTGGAEESALSPGSPSATPPIWPCRIQTASLLYLPALAFSAPGPRYETRPVGAASMSVLLLLLRWLLLSLWHSNLTSSERAWRRPWFRRLSGNTPCKIGARSLCLQRLQPLYWLSPLRYAEEQTGDA